MAEQLKGLELMNDMTLNYHLMHPGGDSIPGDPNAAFCLDGVYHLHYILNHPWKDGKSCSFVHITSPDMLHWTWQTTKLQPSFTGHGMFSGTGFITKEGVPAAIYHGAGSNRNMIAIARDRQLSAWEKPYPVEVDIERHWDPDCFLIGDTYYAISGGDEQPLFRSTDLKNWTLVGNFMRHDMPDTAIGEDVSCPNFFPIAGRWMLLCISHPLGCRYYIGDWDARTEQFVPETHGRMNWRREDQPLFGCFRRTDFFAPESVLTPDGRRVMWAWLTSVGPDNALRNKTIQSLPRELSLDEDGSLLIKPLRELEAQRHGRVLLKDVVLSSPIKNLFAKVPPGGGDELQRIADLPSESCEIRFVIPRAEALRKIVGFVLFADEDGNGLTIALRPDTGTLRVGTTEAPFNLVDLPEDEDVELRIFVDKYLVEVFANNRQAVLAAHMDYAGKTGLDAFTVGATTELKSLELWKLKPTNQGFLEAQNDRSWEPDRE
jgi:sucrose-6-phosphate hydrolase SacC (GH32 family)